MSTDPEASSPDTSASAPRRLIAILKPHIATLYNVLTIAGLVLLLYAVHRLAGPEDAGYLLSSLDVLLALVGILAGFGMRPRRFRRFIRHSVIVGLLVTLTALFLLNRRISYPDTPKPPVVAHRAPDLPPRIPMSVPPETPPRQTLKLWPLTVISTPGDAEVYVDGVFQGLTNRQLQIAAGKHKIRISKQGFKDHHDLVVIPNQTLFPVVLTPGIGQ
jgi:hypothetical protein